MKTKDDIIEWYYKAKYNLYELDNLPTYEELGCLDGYNYISILARTESLTVENIITFAYKRIGELSNHPYKNDDYIKGIKRSYIDFIYFINHQE